MKWIFFLVGILLLSTASAELIIHNQPEITQKVNEEKMYQLSIENTFDFDITDFKFSNLSEFTFSNFTIPKNTTQNIDFNVKFTNSFHGQRKSIVSFKFPVDIPEETQTHNINITDDASGLNEDYIVIRSGDTIIWKNTADGTRAITSSLFYQEIPMNGSFQYIFNNIDTYNYQILISGLAWHTGIVVVINKTSEQKAHNPLYDKELILNINIISNPTIITTEVSKTNFEIEYGKFKKGLLTIKNTGNETAEIVKMSSDSNWVSFNKNDINIPISDEDWIEYTITPQFLETNQTDKSYNLTIEVKASNSNKEIINISIFIPYKVITSGIGDSDLDLMNWLDNVYCPSHPTSFLCDPNLNATNGTIIYKERDIPVNITPSDFFETLKRLQRMEDSSSRTNNDVKILIDMLEREFPGLKQKLNESLTIQVENERKGNIFRRSLWIVGFFVLILISFWVLMRKYNKRENKKNLMEGSLNYTAK